METNVYSIYDSAAKAYTQPFFCQNNGIALRLFSDNINSKDDNNLSRHSSQFTLFHIGKWDDNKGVIEPKTPEAIGNGAEYKEPSQETELTSLITKLLAKLED